jgi:hypothetical protein
MKAKRLIGLLSVVFTFGLFSQAMAAYQPYCYVQNRVYEDGRKFNRFWLEFRDENNVSVPGDLLQAGSLVLTDPNGQEVAVQDLVFTSDRELDGAYDGKKGIWTYDPYFFNVYGYSGVMPGTLLPGDYRISVIFAGVAYEMTYKVNRVLNLIVTPASSITCSVKEGNLICEWPVPMLSSYTHPTLETSTRALLNVVKAGKIIGYAYVTIPMHMGRLFVPASVVNTFLKENADSYEIQIQLRTNDNNNRSYSNRKKLL